MFSGNPSWILPFPRRCCALLPSRGILLRLLSGKKPQHTESEFLIVFLFGSSTLCSRWAPCFVPAVLRSEPLRRRYGLMWFFFFSASPSFLFGRQLHVSQGDFSEVTGSRMVSEARAGWKLCDRERVGAGFSSTDSVDFCCLLETKLTYFLFCFVLFELKVMAERGARVLLSLLCLTSACSLAPARAQKGKCVEVWFGFVWFESSALLQECKGS